MSRRRVSVKELGVVDCQGWLQRRKEGRSFLGSKWKKYWFVLKKSSLYWYTDKTAVKAEGFINLSGFTIEQAKQCKKKHAITATHPLVVTIFVAAENFTEMNKWISKLSVAAEVCEAINTAECYSVDSDQDGDDCSLDSEQEMADTENGDVPQPPCDRLNTSTSSSTSVEPSVSSSQGGTLCRNRRRRAMSDGDRCQSWQDFSKAAQASASSIPLIQVGEEAADAEKSSDEMESLYKHLKDVSLSPTGCSSHRDFRASFIRRSKNDKMNEKVHLLRILSSTLKAKESELTAVELILGDPALTAPTYRAWKVSNLILLQDICGHCGTAGGAAELTEPPPTEQLHEHTHTQGNIHSKEEPSETSLH